MLKNFFKKIKPHNINETIWILYRIDNGNIKTFGHYNDYNKAKKWANAGEYKILESKTY